MMIGFLLNWGYISQFKFFPCFQGFIVWPNNIPCLHEIWNLKPYLHKWLAHYCILFILLQATYRPSVLRKQIGNINLGQEKELFLKILVGFLIVVGGIREIDIRSIICNILMK